MVQTVSTGDIGIPPNTEHAPPCIIYSILIPSIFLSPKLAYMPSLQTQKLEGIQQMIAQPPTLLCFPEFGCNCTLVYHISNLKLGFTYSWQELCHFIKHVFMKYYWEELYCRPIWKVFEANISGLWREGKHGFPCRRKLEKVDWVKEAEIRETGRTLEGPVKTGHPG